MTRSTSSGSLKGKRGNLCPTTSAFSKKNQFKYCAAYLEIHFLNAISHCLPLRMLIIMFPQTTGVTSVLIFSLGAQ